MFFLIGGVSPKTVVLDETRRICPSCGLAQARLQRIDHYLNLFFIPLLRVKKGEPMVVCQRCGAVSSPDARPGAGPRPEPPAPRRCRNCGAPLEPRFNYCPHCGSEV
jgi:RNA polymerase subunit RPABC4/transcription elongation factor Spt4